MIGEINSLVASESLAVLPGVKVEVLAGDYKVCIFFEFTLYVYIYIEYHN